MDTRKKYFTQWFSNKNKILIAIYLFVSFSLVILIWYWKPILQLNIPGPNKEYSIYDTLNDDAFYYLEIAQNIINKSISTFDGSSHTNGYHPLWMLFLLILGILLPINSFSFALGLVFLILIILLFGTLFFHYLHQQLIRDQNFSSSPALVAYAFSALCIARTGVEACLIFLFVPLFLLIFIKATISKKGGLFFLSGLFASMLILSRLDTVLLILVIIIFFLPQIRDVKSNLSNITLFLLGLMPFYLYLLYNLLLYGNFVPISGQAKSLLTTSSIIVSSRGLTSIISRIFSAEYLLLFFIGTIAAIPLAIKYFYNNKNISNRIILAIIIYPFIFFGYYLSTSDWPLWLWYYYPIAISFTFSILLLEKLISESEFLTILYKKHSFQICILALLLILGLRIYKTGGNYLTNQSTIVATEIENFSLDHPGIYAMGDRAGIVSFLLPDALIQLEGIVGDRKMLKNIAKERDLVEVLKEYNVNYYIATNPSKINQCWFVEEPVQAGSFAPKMKANICDDPIFSHQREVQTLIFAIH